MDKAPNPLPHLDTFAVAASLSSFTATARLMGVTQAAISQRIAALEKELGIDLFDRIRGRVVLTASGRRLQELCKKVHALHDQARRELAAPKEAPAKG